GVGLYERTLAFDGWRGALQRRWPLYLGLAATWGVLAIAIWSGPRAYSAGFSSGVSPWTYLLNQSVMIVRYLRLAVWPHNLVVAYGPPAPATLRDVLPDAVVVAVLLAPTAVALVPVPPVGFVAAWGLLPPAPTS